MFAATPGIRINRYESAHQPATATDPHRSVLLAETVEPHE